MINRGFKILQNRPGYSVAGLFIIVFGYFLLKTLMPSWPELLGHIIEAQRYFHKLLSTHIKAVANNTDTYGLTLLAVSFAYGVFHAAGPGHGKAIIITYLASQKESMKQGVAISLIASLFQSLIAIGLISFLVMILNLKFRDVTQTGQQVEQIGYILVILLGVFLAFRALLNLFRSQADRKTVEHQHDEHCNHSYIPDKKLTRMKMLGVALSMGMRPCSGAILVLIYAQVINVYWYGVLATLAIGAGTGMTLAALAVASVFARNWLHGLFQGSRASGHHIMRISEFIALAGGFVLMFLGWSLYSMAAQVAQSHPLL